MESSNITLFRTFLEKNVDSAVKLANAIPVPSIIKLRIQTRPRNKNQSRYSQTAIALSEMKELA